MLKCFCLTVCYVFGLADHDIVYAEIDTWLKRVETPRKIMKYKEANWDKIKKRSGKYFNNHK